MDAVILFGRGMPRGEQEVLFDQLAQQLVKQGVATRVETAFLEMTSPSLGERLNQLAAEGLSRVAVVPAFAPYDRNVKRWLPRYLAFWKTEHGVSLDVVIGPEIEATASFEQSVCESILAANQGVDVQATHKPLRNRQGFSRIPQYTQQIQICLGPRCTMAGAWEVYDELRRSLQANGLEKPGPQRVIPVRTACLQPCNFAPVCSVQPDNIWYGELNPSRIRQIVQEHLVGGMPIDSLAYRPGERVRAAPHQADMQDDYPMATGRAGDMVVKDAFARPAMKLFDAGAVFMEIQNTGACDDRLLSVVTPRSPLPRIHDASHSHRELMQMPFAAVPIPAGGQLMLQPGELHMMLLNFRGEMVEGSEVPLTLHFERAGPLELLLTLHPPAGGHAGMA
jgi:copper(I)-binding protein/(2Fe-2S) ferredoxin